MANHPSTRRKRRASLRVTEGGIVALFVFATVLHAHAAEPTPSPTPYPTQNPGGVPSGFDDAIRLPDGTTPMPSPSPSPTPTKDPIRIPTGFDDAIATPTPAATPTATPVAAPSPTPAPLAQPYRRPREDAPWPLQLNVAGGVVAGDDRRPATPNSIGFGSLYLGTAFSRPGREHLSGAFLGGGVEGTVNGNNGPYQWSGGAGLRAGYAWRGGLDAPIPDAYVYARVTPFLGMRRISEPGYLHADDPVLAENGRGVRIGIGVVAPLWTAAMIGGVGDGDLQGVNAASAEEAVFCLVAGAVMLLTNHVELTWEVYDVPGAAPETLVGARLGAGF